MSDIKIFCNPDTKSKSQTLKELKVNLFSKLKSFENLLVTHIYKQTKN